MTADGKMTIIIADDENLARKSLSMFITREFPNLVIVGEACDGIELKQLLETRTPDIAIIDVQMPGLSGLEVMQLVKSQGNRTHFIVNTAYSEFEYVKQALDLKADGYLLKPMKRQDMVASVARICELVRQERDEEQRREELSRIMETVEPTLASQIVMSVCADNCDQASFASYLRLKHIRFVAGVVMQYVPVHGKIRANLRELQARMEEDLVDVAHYLLSATSDAIILILLLTEEIAGDRREAWFHEMEGIFYEEICAILDQAIVMGTGCIVEEFREMNLSYHSCNEQIRGELTGSPEEPLPDERTSGYAEAARSYFERHYTEDISLTDCADSLRISPYYLSHTFKAVTGMTCLEYLTQIRMERAMELCRDIAVPLKDIGQRCGYNNISYFYKVFKQYTGTTIGKYRKDHQDVITESADA